MKPMKILQIISYTVACIFFLFDIERQILFYKITKELKLFSLQSIKCFFFQKKTKKSKKDMTKEEIMLFEVSEYRLV